MIGKKRSSFDPQVRPPSNFSSETVDQIVRLIRDAEEVEEKGLEDKVSQAQYLGAVSVEGRVVAAGAIKRKFDNHRKTVMKKSGYPALKNYSAEIGYMAVGCGHRGKGYGNRIFEALVRNYKGSLYATTRTDNEHMHRILRRHGFRCVGKAWPSIRPGKMICLWIGEPIRGCK